MPELAWLVQSFPNFVRYVVVGFALAAWMIIIMTLSMVGYLLLRRRAERWRRA